MQMVIVESIKTVFGKSCFCKKQDLRQILRAMHGIKELNLIDLYSLNNKKLKCKN